jgi:hypothetical protein
VRLLWIVLLCSCAAGCAQPDYRRFREYQPKSIVVLPPVNASNSVRAPELYLASVAKPLGEAGYYVFPPLAVLKYFHTQGVPTGAEANEIAPARLHQVFGADAALYAVIEEWGVKYLVLASHNVVRVHLSLVDLRRGLEIWAGSAQADDSSQNEGDLVGALVGSLVHGLLSASAGAELELSRRAMKDALHDRDSGLLIGPKRPNFSEDTRGTEAAARD